MPGRVQREQQTALASRVLLSLKMEGGGQLTSYMYKDPSKRLQKPVYAF